MPQAFVCGPPAAGKSFGAAFELGHFEAPPGEHYLMAPAQPDERPHPQEAAVTLARGQVQQARAAVSLASLGPQPAPPLHAALFSPLRQPAASVASPGAPMHHLAPAQPPPSAPMHLSGQSYALEQQPTVAGQHMQSLGSLQDSAYAPLLEFAEQPAPTQYQSNLALAPDVFAAAEAPHTNGLVHQQHAQHAQLVSSSSSDATEAAGQTTIIRLIGHNSKEGATTSATG